MGSICPKEYSESPARKQGMLNSQSTDPSFIRSYKKPFQEVFQEISKSQASKEPNQENSFLDSPSSLNTTVAKQSLELNKFDDRVLISDIPKKLQNDVSEDSDEEVFSEADIPEYDINLDLEGALALKGPSYIKRFFKNAFKKEFRKSENRVWLLIEKLHKKFSTVFSRELNLAVVSVDDERNNQKYEDIKNLLRDFVHDLTHLVKKLYKQKIATIDNLMIHEDDFDAELMIKIELYEVLLQQPHSVLNKTILNLLKNKYPIGEHGDYDDDGKSILNRFESLSSLEGKIFHHLIQHNKNEPQVIQKMINVGEKITSDDEIGLVRKFMLKMNSNNQIVSDDNFQHLVNKNYMDNIHVFRVFNTHIINNYFIEDLDSNNNRELEAQTNIFKEKAWETVSRNLDEFVKSFSQTKQSE